MAKPGAWEFYGSWINAFPDAHVEINGLQMIDDVVVEEGTFTRMHNGTFRSPTGDIAPTGTRARKSRSRIVAGAESSL